MPIDTRFSERSWITQFANTANTTLRSLSDQSARRIITLLTGTPPDGDSTAPDVPTNLSAIAGVESVTLSWTPSVALDTSRYRVQRSTTSGSGMATVGETSASTFISPGLTGGTPYYFQIAAIDDSGNVSAYTDEVTATPTASGGAGTLPTAPDSVSATALDDRVLIRWNVTDPLAVFSTVYRDTDTGGPYTAIVTGQTGEAYLDNVVTNGTEYFYVVTSTNSNGDESAYSLEVSATPAATANPDPDPVVLTTVTGGSQQCLLTWTNSVATDFALYRIKWGTTTATYTEEVEVPIQAPTYPYPVPGLADNDEFFFVVEVEDSAGNVSVVSNEESATTFPAVIQPSPTTAAVTGFSLLEEGDGFVSVTWTPNTEDDVLSYYLYRDSGEGGQVTAVATVAHPTNTYEFDGLTNGVTYRLAIASANTTGLLSDRVVITGTPASVGGGTGPGDVGGGTGVGGEFSGDTDLGALHKAPGATFDIVLNCSGTAFMGSNMWGLIRSAATLYAAAQPQGFTWTNKRVAILLPERTFNVHDTNGSFGVVFNSTENEWWGIHVQLPQAAGIQWHFIAPWPTASLSDSSATAAAEECKFKMRHANAEGLTLSAGGRALVQMGWNGNSPGTRFGWWFCEFQATARETMTTPSGYSSYAFLTLYGCDFLADVHFESGLHLGHISTFGISIDQVHYCFFDDPWGAWHTIYERSPGPVGNCSCTNTVFSRTGGAAWQSTRRNGGGENGFDQTLGAASAGTHTFTDVTVKDFGRCSERATAAFTQYGTRRDLVFDGCTVVTTLAGQYGATGYPWPPPDPYQYDLPEVGMGTTRTADFIQMGSEGGEPTNNTHASTAGRAAGSLTITDCDIYIKNPTAAIVRCNHSTGIDISDSSLLTATDATETKAVMLTYDTRVANGPYPAPAFPVLSFDITSSNTGARRTAFVAAHTEVPADAVLATTVNYAEPTAGNPLVGIRNVSGPTNLGAATATISRTNLV